MNGCKEPDSVGTGRTQAGPGEAETCDHKPVLQAVGNAVLTLQEDRSGDSVEDGSEYPDGQESWSEASRLPRP